MLALLAKWANWLVVCWGWRRWAVAAAFGGVLALSLAPFFVLPLLFLALTALVFLMDGAVTTRSDGRQSTFWPGFALGWWFGFGYFLAGLWWIGSAFLVEAERFGWLLPFAVILMPAGLALFWAVGLGVARLLWSPGIGRVLSIAAGLTAAEWARSHVLTGFPWNLIGTAIAPHPIGMQSAALIGTEGLTFLALLFGLSPALLVSAESGRKRTLTERRFLMVVAGLAVLHVGYGAVRLATAQDDMFEELSVRIVQPSIDQAEKWLPENRSRVFNTFLELSDRAVSPEQPGLSQVTHLVWPETAFPFVLLDEPGALAALAALLPDHTMLFSGAARRDPTTPPAANRYFNSVYAIDGSGQIAAAYDKVHLVPFGEYLPFQSVLEAIGLEQLTRVKGGFESGPSYRTISTLPGTPPFLPLICFEILFPYEGRAAAAEAAWILNVTNDAWFGETPGPYQHLHAAQLRAVVDGLAVIRAANTGISAAIDPYGRILRRLELGDVGVIDTALPQPLPSPPLASRLPLGFGFALAAICGLIAFSLKRRSSQREQL